MAQSKNSGGTRRITRTERSSVNPHRISNPPSEKAYRDGGAVHKTNTPHKRRKVTRQDLNSQRAVSSKSTKAKKKFKLINEGEMDYTFLFLVILVVSMGLIVLLSASAPAGGRMFDDSYSYFKKQLLFVIIGFALMLGISRLELESFHRWIPLAFGVCVFLLIIVLIPGIGVKVNGARRWLNIPLIQLQPSEFMKPIIAMTIAYAVKCRWIDLTTFKGNMVCAAGIGFVALLLMLETHLSGTIVIVGIAICVMFAAGTPVKPMLIAGGVLAIAVVIYLQFDEVRMARIYSFIDPFEDAQNSSYQISQSLYAIGSGRLFGLGLGQSVQKYSNLPEPYNDFIFAVICEELGFFGAVIVILLFSALFIRSIRIAINARDIWSALTCIGIASQLGIQTVLNMGVAVSLIPNTGVSLPFFSYGGTSITTLLMEMGILLNVSRQSVK